MESFQLRVNLMLRKMSLNITLHILKSSLQIWERKMKPLVLLAHAEDPSADKLQRHHFHLEQALAPCTQTPNSWSFIKKLNCKEFEEKARVPSHLCFPTKSEGCWAWETGTWSRPQLGPDWQSCVPGARRRSAQETTCLLASVWVDGTFLNWGRGMWIQWVKAIWRFPFLPGMPLTQEGKNTPVCIEEFLECP